MKHCCLVGVRVVCIYTEGLLLLPLQKHASDRVVIDDRKSKSFEEREEQYVEARNRIFHQQHSSVSG